jgi:hypothetical protein
MLLRGPSGVCKRGGVILQVRIKTSHETMLNGFRSIVMNLKTSGNTSYFHTS